MVQAVEEMSPTRQNDAYLRGQSPDDYDKAVYENTPFNWVRIVVTLLAFYVFQALHWWFNFELGINESLWSTYYNLIIFATAVVVIGVMLCFGAVVN